jgi:hypothetical protein
MFGKHILKLFERLSIMEKFKNVNPCYSHACDTLVTKLYTLMDGVTEFVNSARSKESSTMNYF